MTQASCNFGRVLNRFSCSQACAHVPLNEQYVLFSAQTCIAPVVSELPQVVQEAAHLLRSPFELSGIYF